MYELHVGKESLSPIRWQWKTGFPGSGASWSRAFPLIHKILSKRECRMRRLSATPWEGHSVSWTKDFPAFPDARCAADARWTAAVRETLIFIPAPIRLEMFVPIPIRFILIQLPYFHLLLRQLSLPFFILHLLALVQQWLCSSHDTAEAFGSLDAEKDCFLSCGIPSDPSIRPLSSYK